MSSKRRAGTLGLAGALALLTILGWAFPPGVGLFSHDSPGPASPAAARPRVLLLGDSISLGYAPHVRAALGALAEVHHPGENCRSTQHGLSELERWLGSERWDVIHFNFGLHDLKFCDANRRRVSVDEGAQLVPLETYRANLSALVARLQPRTRVLLWGTLTPYRDDVVGLRPADHARYDAAAREVMRAAGVPCVELGALLAGAPELLDPDGLHPAPAGYARLGAAVSAAVGSALAQPAPAQTGR